MATSEIEETMKRIQAHKGVIAVVIVNNEGIPIRFSANMEPKEAVQYSANLTQLITKARAAVRELDSQNDLTFMRVRSKKHEILVAPEKEYLLIVVQNPNL